MALRTQPLQVHDNINFLNSGGDAKDMWCVGALRVLSSATASTMKSQITHFLFENALPVPYMDLVYQNACLQSAQYISGIPYGVWYHMVVVLPASATAG